MRAGGHGEPARGPVPLGVVTRAHGVRGELRVHPHNPSSDVWPTLDRVWLRGPSGGERRFEVRRARSGGTQGVILALEGVGSRDQAEALRGWEVCVERAELPALGPDEWYVRDLVGLSVCDERGTVGEVVDVLNYPTVDCLRVRRTDGTECEVPMADPWLIEVDLEAGEVRVGALDSAPVSRGSGGEAR